MFNIFQEPGAAFGIPPEVVGVPPAEIPPEVIGATPTSKKKGRKPTQPKETAAAPTHLTVREQQHLTTIAPPVPAEAPPGAAASAAKPPPKPRGNKGALNQLMLNPDQRDQWFNLPDGWRKQIVIRKSGNTAGGYDVYVYPPVGKKLRSMNDILRWVQANPTVPIDPSWVNMSPPINPTGETRIDKKIEELIDNVQLVKETGELPTAGSFKRASQPTTKPTGLQVKDGSTPKPPKAKKAKIASPPKFQLSPAQVMQLEVYYLNSVGMPSTAQLAHWSKEMGLGAKDIKAWFQTKWKARLETEARLKTLAIMTAAARVAFDKQSSAGEEGGFDGESPSVPLSLLSRRPINPDVFSSSTGLS